MRTLLAILLFFPAVGSPLVTVDHDTVVIDSSESSDDGGPVERTAVTALVCGLRDGTQQIALPGEWYAVPLRSFIGEIEIPLNRVTRIEMEEDRETATLTLWNGDHLTGVIDQGTLPLLSKQGEATSIHLADVESIRVETGHAAPGNVAAADAGATVTGPAFSPESLIDGESSNFTDNRGFAHGPLNEPWVITLARPYELHGIRMRLWDGDERTFGYEIETSPDGKNFEPLEDRSAGGHTGWQELKFQPRRVKAIRLTGRANSFEDRPKNAGLFVVELEAYCEPPPHHTAPHDPALRHLSR